MLKDNIDKRKYDVSHRSRKKRKKRYIPNGIIHSSLRLSIALRFFAGRCPLDISLVHDVSPTEVQHSAWKVVDAVHQNPAFNINYPASHAEQINIAKEFSKVSYAGFNNCAGCIDSLLI